MKQSKKAFTIVELIIVVTILAILSTLSFIGYSSYTVSARDAVRESDLTILHNSFKSISLRGSNLSLFVDTGSLDNTGSGEFYFGGKNISGDSNYKAGGVNYDLLTDLSSPLLDPTTNRSYIIGIYKSDYELSASLEETKTSKIISSYKKRTSSGTTVSLTGTVDNINNSIELLNVEENVKFKIGDLIGTGTTNTKEIVDIVGRNIYLDDVSGISFIDKIKLYKNDTGLVGNTKIGKGVGTNCSDLTDLEENICPIKEDTPGLVPY